jgi:hypothetical protein
MFIEDVLLIKWIQIRWKWWKNCKLARQYHTHCTENKCNLHQQSSLKVPAFRIISSSYFMKQFIEKNRLYPFYFRKPHSNKGYILPLIETVAYRASCNWFGSPRDDQIFQFFHNSRDIPVKWTQKKPVFRPKPWYFLWESLQIFHRAREN